MDTIKATIYSTLSALAGVSVAQESQTVFNDLPTVTFSLSNIVGSQDLDGNLLSEDSEIKIDIWGGSSTQASSTLASVEAAMRGIGYNLAYTQDVPNPDATLFHITTRFRAAVVVQ